MLPPTDDIGGRAAVVLSGRLLGRAKWGGGVGFLSWRYFENFW